MVNNNFIQYADGLSKIDKFFKEGVLYRKELTDDLKIVNKSLGGLLWSIAKHAFYVVTFQDKKIEAIERYKCISFFETNMRLLNVSANPENGSKKFSLDKDFSPEQLLTINQISKTFKEKFPDLKILIEQQLSKINESALSKLTPQEFSLNDVDSVNLQSQPEKPVNLKKFLSGLNNESQVYYEKCLGLNSQLLLLSLNGQLEITNLDEIKTIKEATNSIYSLLKPLHKQFVKNYGPVPIVEGQLRPSLKQLKGAFSIAMDKIVPYLQDGLTPEGKILLARMTQYIMCGGQINAVEYPENEFCFTTDELSKVEDKYELPERFSNLYEWHIKERAELIENARKIEEITKQLAKSKEPLKTERLETDLRKLKTNKENLISKSVSGYLVNFFQDIIKRSSLIIFNNTSYNLFRNEKDSDLLFSAIRDDFFNQMLDPKKQIAWIEYNKSLATSAGIPNDLSSKEFNQILSKNATKASSEIDQTKVNMIIARGSFTEQQKAKLLKNIDPEKQKEHLAILESQLRSRMLQIMLTANQSALGVDPLLMNGKLESHPLMKLSSGTSMQYASIQIGANHKLSSDDQVSASTFSCNIPLSEAENRGVLTRLDSENEDIPMLSLQYKLELHNFIDSDNPSLVTLTNYSNIRFRVQSLPMLDDFDRTFNPKGV